MNVSSIAGIPSMRVRDAVCKGRVWFAASCHCSMPQTPVWGTQMSSQALRSRSGSRPRLKTNSPLTSAKVAYEALVMNGRYFCMSCSWSSRYDTPSRTTLTVSMTSSRRNGQVWRAGGRENGVVIQRCKRRTALATGQGPRSGQVRGFEAESKGCDQFDCVLRPECSGAANGWLGQAGLSL